MIHNVEMWNNHIRMTKDLELSSDVLESTIKGYPYEGEGKIKDPAVENAELPPIAIVFYSLAFDKGYIPNTSDLVNAYLKQDYFLKEGNTVITNYNGKVISVNYEGLKARVLRTYPSIVRDLHFYLLAVESGYFQAVRYSFIDDFQKGVDIKVQFNNRWYSVALMQNTARSIFFRNRKYSRHSDRGDIVNIELDRRNCKLCGDYFLYTKKHIDDLVTQLNGIQDS